MIPFSSKVQWLNDFSAAVVEEIPESFPWRITTVWYFLCGDIFLQCSSIARSPIQSWYGKMSRLSQLLDRKPSSASPGLWEVGRVVQPQACPVSQDEAEWCQAVFSEIRGSGDTISGLITCCPKLLLAEDEVLTCLAWMHFSVRNWFPCLNSPKSFTWPEIPSHELLLVAMDTFAETPSFRRGWGEL